METHYINALILAIYSLPSPSRSASPSCTQLSLPSQFHIMDPNFPRHTTERGESSRQRTDVQSDAETRPRPTILTDVDQWLQSHRERYRHPGDVRMDLVRGYRGPSSYNEIKTWDRTGPRPRHGVDPREDHRRLPKLDYTLAMVDDRGKRRFITPKKQYDSRLDSYFQLDWNQTEFSGESASVLEWPVMFKERNVMEAKCRARFEKVPKCRALDMLVGRRLRRPHNDVSQRLQVEMNAMSRRLMRSALIEDAVREAEQNQSDPRAIIRSIRADPQYATDPEISDYSDEE